MKQPPILSVIIPVFNRESTINRAIQSVLAQTFGDYEIIVVDDGSADQTLQIVQGIKDSRIKVIEHERNMGPAAARNSGMMNAGGQYIAWLDSDDEWLPEKIEKQISLLSQIPSLAAVCTAFTVVQGKTTYDYIPLDKKPWKEGLLFGCDLGPGTTLLVRRDAALATGPLDTRLTCYEDWDWLLRLTEKYEMALLPRVLAKVYKNNGRRPAIVESSVEEFIRKHQTKFIALGGHRSRKALARMWLDIAWAYYMDGSNMQRERYYFWKAIRLDQFQPAGVYFGLLDSVLGTHWSNSLYIFKMNNLKKIHR